ncbi:MAG: ChbG/HpnK family deacetylase [Coriobacteriia bacterium]|nr:ChbG/HpnK family deacetylase [Coriobacteriia bacterium]
MNVIYHADDFGLSVAQSQAILDCSAACGGTGTLNSTSMVVTSPNAAACAKLVAPHVEAGAIKLGLHLNLVEGPSCAPASEVGLLVNDRGMFCRSFANLLAATTAAAPAADLIAQVYVEVRCQLQAFLALFPNARGALRVDSHQHFHMIPVVFDALLDAIKQEGCTLEYMRIPSEPAAPFAATPGLYRQYAPINGVKHSLLNVLWAVNKKKFPQWQERSAVFCGLVLSGRMELVVQHGLLDRFQAYAAERGRALEVLFHPGGMDNAQDCLDPQLKGFVDFYLSPHRGLEAAALRGL